MGSYRIGGPKPNLVQVFRWRLRVLLLCYFNFIPQVDLHGRLPILRDSVTLYCTPRFEVIGLSFLLNLDVSFGIWFFTFCSSRSPTLSVFNRSSST